MQVAYLVNSYPLPSHSFIRREIQALERRGVRVHRFAMRGDRARLVDPGDIAEFDRTEHVLARPGRLAAVALAEIGRNPVAGARAARLAAAAGWRSDRNGPRHLTYLAEALYVARRCRALGVEHLHAHFGTNSATVAMLVRALGGPPYSFTVHGPEEFDSPRALALDLKVRDAAFAVAISAFGRSQLCRWAEPAAWPRIRVVHCGIEPWRFPDAVLAAAPMPEGPLRLVAVGRLAEQKGQLALVEALARARAAGVEARLVLVGDGEMRGGIEAAIAAAGLGDRITITGWVDEARVRAELAAAHALVMPSFAEGLPMVIMEAMAAGRPVLATWVAGIPELVTPETGWLVPAGDADALAAAIAGLAETPRQTLAGMGRAGHARVLARHDIDGEAEKLAALFAGSIAAARAAGVERPPVLDDAAVVPGQ